MNVRLRKVLVEEARLPSRYTGFDSVIGKRNSSLIKDMTALLKEGEVVKGLAGQKRGLSGL